jgi:SAM-dependent methyltransferase
VPLPEAAQPQNAVEQMRADWNARAQENARFYICTDVPADEASFFASGRDDYDRFVRPFLLKVGFDPRGKRALEIGCGIGRMTRRFAQEFDEVLGIDISEEMVARAQSFGVPRARFEVCSGGDLQIVPDASVDFVFSYIVFQHIPKREIILGYVEEIGRVLRPGGIFRFHVNGLPYARVGGTLLEGYISRSPKLRRVGLRALPFVRRVRPGTWMGHPVSVSDVRSAARRGDLRLTEVTGRWTAHMWVGGKKHGG